MNELSIFDRTTIEGIKNKYANLTETETYQAEQSGAISLIEFVVLNDNLFSNLKDYLMEQKQTVCTTNDVQKFLDREDMLLSYQMD